MIVYGYDGLDGYDRLVEGLFFSGVKLSAGANTNGWFRTNHPKKRRGREVDVQ